MSMPLSVSLPGSQMLNHSQEIHHYTPGTSTKQQMYRFCWKLSAAKLVRISASLKPLSTYFHCLEPLSTNFQCVQPCFPGNFPVKMLSHSPFLTVLPVQSYFWLSYFYGLACAVPIHLPHHWFACQSHNNHHIKMLMVFLFINGSKFQELLSSVCSSQLSHCLQPTVTRHIKPQHPFYSLSCSNSLSCSVSFSYYLQLQLLAFLDADDGGRTGASPGNSSDYPCSSANESAPLLHPISSRQQQFLLQPATILHHEPAS